MKTENEFKTLLIDAGVRYWEDATIDGVEDTEGSLTPCKEGDRWVPEVDIKSGQILNWTKGVTADVHFKICDDGIYTVLDKDGKEVLKVDGYVPSCLSPGGSGYGDYIIMKIDSEGFIDGWKFNASEFEN